MVVDLEQLKKRAERLEELAKQKDEEIELKRRIRIAKATLRKDTIVAKLFTALKEKANNAINP
jgi:hypothetical protein